MEAVNLFLIEEYKSAIQLTFHVDNQRVQLTKFFITFVGIILGGFLALNNSEKSLFFMFSGFFFGSVLFFLWLIGAIIIAIMARLRKVQLEHFRIVLNIRKSFGNDDINFWNAVQLSELTIPKGPNWSSGTFYWMTLVIVINSSLIPLALSFCLDPYNTCYFFILGLSLFISIVILYILYFRLSKSNREINYNEIASVDILTARIE